MSTITPTRPAMPRPVRPAGATASALKATKNIDPLRVLRRHIFGIIGSALLGAALGTGAFVAFDEYMPFYSGQVLFEVKPGLSESRDIGVREISNEDIIMRVAETESVLLTSRDVLRNALAHREIEQTSWRGQFVDPTGVFAIDDAIDDLIEGLDSEMVRGSNLFRLKWSTKNRVDVPIILNRVATAYMEKRKELDKGIFDDNMNVFRTQLQAVNRQLDDLNTQIEEFIRQKGITNLDDPRYGVVAQRVESLQGAITDAALRLQFALTARAQTAAKLLGTVEPSPDDISLAEQDPAISQVSSAILGVKTEMRHRYERFAPDHPSIREIEGRLNALVLEKENKINEVVKRNLDSKLKILEDQIEQLGESIEKNEEELEEADRELRELSANQSRYDSMVNQRQYLEAERDAHLNLVNQVKLMQLRDDATRIRIAQAALTPRQKAFPRMHIVVPLGMILTMGLFVGIVFLRELTDQRIKGASDLDVLPNASVLGVIPDLAEDPTKSDAAELVLYRHPMSVLAESYRQVASSIQRGINRGGHQTLLFVGGMPAAGTTTAVTNFAAAQVAAGRNVLVVDANFRRPRLPQALDVAGDGPGLGDVLAGSTPLSEAIIEAECGVCVMPAGTPANRLFDRVNSVAFDSLLSELRSRYDLIVFDAPPAVVAGDALTLAHKIDAAVLVVRANQEQRGLVARLINQFMDMNCDLLGILLNRARGTAGGYFKKNFATMAEYSKSPK